MRNTRHWWFAMLHARYRFLSFSWFSRSVFFFKVKITDGFLGDKRGKVHQTEEERGRKKRVEEKKIK